MPTQAFLVKWKHRGTIRPAHTLIFGEALQMLYVYTFISML